jgi:hypothetical protein
MPLEISGTTSADIYLPRIVDRELARAASFVGAVTMLKP